MWSYIETKTSKIAYNIASLFLSNTQKRFWYNILISISITKWFYEHGV